jgi:thioester reductase-like protein
LLLTGTTGYLGAFLLREYYEHSNAQIILPVRGDDPEKRLFSNLAFYFGETFASAIVNDTRLDVVSVDLSRGMDVKTLADSLKDQPLDLILHSAAAVNHYGSPDQLTAGNVTAVENLLGLVKNHEGCIFAHISTLGAVNRQSFTELDRDIGPPALNAYSRTKQLAEKNVFKAGEQGRKIMIFRTGNLVLDYENGKSPRNASGNMFLRLARMVGVTGLGARTSGKMGYAFVDQAARAIRLIAQTKGFHHQEQPVFHIDTPHKMTLPEVLSMADDSTISLLSGSKLKTELETLARMAPGDKGVVAKEYLAWIHQHDREVAEGEIFLADVKMDWTLAVLRRLGFSWGKITPRLASAILNRALTLDGTSDSPKEKVTNGRRTG